MPLAHAADYPNKPIRFVVPYAPGGAATNLAHLVAEKASAGLNNQKLVVDNKPGAGTAVGLDIVAGQAPDGYTIGLTSSSLPILPITTPGFTRDPIKDFTPVSVLTKGPFVVAVNAGVPAANIGEFIAWARKNPGKVNLGASGITDQLIVVYLNQSAGLDIVSIPYKGGGPATTAMIAGDVHFVLLPIGTVGAHVQSGRSRALAVTTLQPTALVPGVPALSSIVPGFEASFWFGILGPAGMSKDVVTTLHQAFKIALADPAVLKFVNAEGTDAIGSTPEEMAGAIRREAALWGPLARKAAEAAK